MTGQVQINTKGKREMSIKKLNGIKKKVTSFILALAMIIPSLLGTGMTAVAAVGTVSHYAQYSYAGLTLGEFEVDVPQGTGIHAWCAEHYKNPPHEGEPINSVTESTNENLRKVLYYGVFGPGQIIENTHRGCTITTLATSLACGNPQGVSLQEAIDWYNQVINMPSPPKGFKAYIAETADNARQNLAFFVYEPEGDVELYKSSADPTITNGHPCYSLKGAKYGIFSGNTQVATIETDANGYGKVTEIEAGNYTLRELSASPGYAVDENSYPFTVEPGGTATLRVSEQPTNDPMAITLAKIDQGSGDATTQGAASLEGAEFTVKYYDGYYTENNLPEKATRTWVLKTKKVTGSSGKIAYQAILNEEFKISGDDFYYINGNPDPTLPLGTLSIEETKAPNGYLLDGAYFTPAGSDDKITGKYVAQITQDGNLARLNGGNKYSVSDMPIRGDFDFNKKDEETKEPMANIPFKITSKSTGETHTVYTDENGYWSSSADYNKHTSKDGIWFGEGDPDDSKGALPYDTYTVEELRCDANEGKTLVKFTVTISRNNYTVNMGTIENSDLTLSTVAKDESTNSHYSAADGEVTIIDTVSYTGLRKGQEYTLVGTLMNKATGAPVTDAAGNPVTATKTFKPATAEGTTEVEFTFDASKLAGADVVVFEKLYQAGTEIIAHEDINDEDQTIHFPGIGTKASDSETNGNISNADKDVTIVDTVSYTNLRKGRTYTVTGKLMDKETGKPVLDADGKEITASTKFKAESTNGSVKVTFKFDGSNLAGQTIVVFEDVEYNGKLYATHADINDEAQTIHFPEVKTTAKDSETDIRNSFADEEITIVDTVSYKNVVPGKEYTVKGILMDKETGEKLLVDGKSVKSEATFTAESAEGTVDVTFTFDGTGLEGKSLVVFENLYFNGFEVAAHADIEDEGQTILIPEIGTTAKDSETEIRNSYADEEITIIDTVDYKNLIVGKEYTVKGVLMDKETGEELLINGETVSAETKFTAETAEGTVDVTFTFDGTGFEGKSLVVFEDLYYNEFQVAVHADIEDEGQTVLIPEIGTTAKDEESNSQNANADHDVTIVDTVKYVNLIPSKGYKVSGKLMDVSTGKPLLVDGKEVTGETVFTPEKSEGSVDVVFKFDGSALKGQTIVVFENVTHNDKIVATHEDITDKDQTIYFPEIGTTASDAADGDKEITSSGTVSIKDKVEYKNLIPGKEYVVKGTLMDKATGKALTVNGKEVTAESKFIAQEANGSVDVIFTFNAEGLGNKTTVVFESLTIDGSEVATHTDINDEAQTVKFIAPPTKVKTGDNNTMYLLIAGAGILIIAGAAFFIRGKKKTPK